MLLNETKVSVSFVLRVPSDGTAKAVSYEEFVNAVAKPALVPHCKQFTMSPTKGVIAPDSSVNIEVMSTFDEDLG